MSGLSLSGLRAIQALAMHGSMTAAAGALGYTPSAISQQISRLERDVHQVLIERHGQRTRLTIAGEILAETAGRISLELENMTAELQSHTQTVVGQLKIAAFATAARGVIPTAIQRLQHAWPQLELQFIEANSRRAIELVAGGIVDLAVAHDWTSMPLTVPDGVRARAIGCDISDVLVHYRHPLAGKETVEMEDMCADSWLYQSASVAHDFLLESYRDSPNPKRFVHMVCEYATQIDMVAAGLGNAFVPRMGRGSLPPTVRTLNVRSAPMRQVYGVWRTSSTRPAIKSALEVLQTVCAELEEPQSTTSSAA
jgi:DNA-binding transcriptional LysR family regulator